MGAPMTSAVTSVAIPPTPVFAYNAEPSMEASGVTVSTGSGSDVYATGSTNTTDSRQSEDTKSAQASVQVPNALLGIFMANIVNPPTAPDPPPAAASPDFAVYAAASSQRAYNESSGGSFESSDDRGASESGSSASGVSADHQETSNSDSDQESSSSVHILPPWHIRPRMRVVSI